MIRDKKDSQPVLDLTGPDGNVFVVLAHGKNWAKQMGLDWAAIYAEATSGDYEHVIATMEKYFGDFVIFER